MTLEDLYNGASRDIRYKNRVTCTICTGTGLTTGLHYSAAHQQNACERCHKSGTQEYSCVMCDGTCVDNSIDGQPDNCGLCNGTGSIMDYCELCYGTGSTHLPQNRCETCDGKRILTTLQLANFQIRRGMSHGHTMVHAQGNIEVKLRSIRHPVFRRQGDDLIMNLRIKLFESTSGFSKVIRTLDGRGLLITNPAGRLINDGDVKCILNEGMPLLDNTNQKGRLIVSFEVIQNNLPHAIPPNYIPIDTTACNMVIS